MMADAARRWNGGGERFDAGVTRVGSGPVALLLPALRSISSRDEMAPLSARLERRFSTVAVDWPGFGTAPKSRAEMEALSALPGIETVVLPRGKLSLHEEFSDEVAAAILGFAPGRDACGP